MTSWFPRIALTLLAVSLAHCTSEVNVPASTQLLLRIDTPNLELRRSLDTLGLRLFSLAGDAWVPGSTAEFPRQSLTWPVELPLTPKDKALLDRQFEVVVQALDNEQVLAETRAVTRFAVGRRVVLSLYLERCPGGDERSVCTEADCHGLECKVCKRGSCVEVGETDAKSLPDWTPDTPDDGTNGDAGGKIDAGDAGATRDAGRADARSAVTPDEASVEPGPPDATLPTTDDCAPEDLLRCGATSGSRQRCSAGKWTATDPCPATQVCNPDSTPPGACRMLSPVCVGNSGQTVCDGNVMQFCNQAGEAERPMQCMSERHCELGKAAGMCAQCLPGAFRCTGASLEVCAEDGQSYKLKEACPSATLCSATSGSCDMGCTVGTKTCAGDELRACGAERTFTAETTCQPGLCDAQGQQCDTCIANTKSCIANNAVTCRADGQGTTMVACTAPKRLCRGSGVCVECAANSDCAAPSNACLSAVCNVAMGVCETTPKLSGTTCTGGFCDGQGNCGECRQGDTQECGSDVGRCSKGTQTCSSGRWGACTGGVMSTAEVCNSIDDDCDNTIDDGASCSGMGVRTRCISGRCVQCGTGAACPSGQVCNSSGVCESACGNNRLDSGEQCDPTAAGYSTFNCSNDCRSRNIYERCGQDPAMPIGPGSCTDRTTFCAAYGSSEYFCVPQVGQGGSASQCPAIMGYRWVLTGLTEFECLIPCTPGRTGECPSPQAPNCFTNPFPPGVPAGWCAR